MSATDQWAVSMPIREVLADPDLAGRASCAVCSGPGRSGLVGVRGRRRDRRAAPRRAPVSAPTAATASASKRWPPPSGRWKPAIPELCTGSFFPFLLHPRRRVDKAPMRRDLLGPESRGVHTQGLATWCGPWATSRASRARRSQGSATGIDEGVHEFLARSLDRTWFPHVFAGRHRPGRGSGAPCGPPGAGGGHRRVGPGPSGDPGTWPWATPRRLTSGSFLSCGPCESAGSRSPHPTTPRAWCRLTGDAHAGIRAAVRAILPGAAWQRRRAPLRPQHHRPGSARPAPEPAVAPISTMLRPHQQGGRHRPVPARHRHFKGRPPFRIAQMLIDAEPDPTAFATTRPPGEHWTKIRPQQPHRAPWAARPGAEQTSPRVLPDSESARPLIGSALPEQRGVAVRRTPPPLPDLTAPPDRHAPHQQQHQRPPHPTT